MTDRPVRTWWMCPGCLQGRDLADLRPALGICRPCYSHGLITPEVTAGE